jgi:hypothetical protein
VKPVDVSGRPLRVVYLAGSGHTGSTLLALLLDSHPGIVSVGEIAVKPRIRRRGDAASQVCSCGSAIAECPFWRQLFRGMQDRGFSFGPTRWTNDYRSEHPWLHTLLTRDSSKPIVRRAQEWAAHHLPIYRSQVAQTDRTNVAFIETALELTGAEVFFDTSKHLMRLSRLLEIGALDVKVITLVRDVRGYVASRKRRGVKIEDAAWTWRKDQEAIAALTDALPSERKMVLKYEELCTHTCDTLRRLYQFCGVNGVEPIMSTRSNQHHVLGNNMRRGGTIEARLDESWRDSLGAHEQQQIISIAGTLREQCGYV